MLWAVQAAPYSSEAPQVIVDGDGRKFNVLALDDQTGYWYCGGINVSQTWTNGASGLQLVAPVPTADPRIWTLPAAPKLLLLFRGNGALLLAGANNDFVVNGTQITLNFTPGAGETFQAVIG